MKKKFLSGMMTMDLSHTISPGMPYYPGTEPPVFSRPYTVASHRFTEQKITILTHTGTHVDAPAHIFEAGATLEQLGLPYFVGSAVALDLTHLPANVIAVDDLRPFRHLLLEQDFVLLRTGWCKHWGKAAYFSGYPVLSEAAALWLAGFDFKGIGIDAISFDPHDSSVLPVHRIFLARNIVLIENLINLEKIHAAEFFFCCLPLKIAEADGAPVRAIALWDDRDKKSKGLKPFC